MPIQWTDDLATGIDRIDQQHRELYAAVARLHESMQQNRLADVPSILDLLQRYALEHFGTEEQAMEAAAYPELPAHREAHQAFVREFLVHRARLERGVSASGVVELSQWLGGWLREHVRKVDVQMALYLRPRREHAPR